MAGDGHSQTQFAEYRPGWSEPWLRPGLTHQRCGTTLTLFAPVLIYEEWRRQFDAMLAEHEAGCHD